MVSDLISLIFKLKPLVYSGALIFLLSACSSAKKTNQDEESLRLDQELSKLGQKIKNIDYGPTLKAGGAFEDRTDMYGLLGETALAMNAADFNFDGYTDLVLVPSYYSRPKFLLFDQKVKKFKAWNHDPLPSDFKTSFILIFDMNRDKVPDLIAAVLNQKSELTQIPVKFYKGVIENKLLYFREEPEAIKLPPEPTSSISILDFDLDGWPDLFVGNWFENKQGDYRPVADRLLKNVKGKFIEVTNLLTNENKKTNDQIYPPAARPTYGSSTCDIDQNGYPDILTSSSAGQKNKLWMNLKEAASDERFFEDLGVESGYASDPDGSLIPTGGGRTFFSACTDYNDDGLMDVFLGELSHAYDNESVDRSSILTGSKETYPPSFLRTEYLSDELNEAWNQGDRRGVWVDYNLDGRVDLIVDNSGFPPYSRLVLFEQDDSRAFVNHASQLGIDVVNPTGTITIDINQDGRPDLITAQNNIRKSDIRPRLYVFENTLKIPGRKSIKVHLDGVKSNSSGLGAMVMLYTKKDNTKTIQRRWVEYSQGGLMSQNEEGIIFGVDEGVSVVGAKVRWPIRQSSGVKQSAALERLYSLEGYTKGDSIELTFCEDGKVLSGKISCQF
jgi:hypothetical protein